MMRAEFPWVGFHHCTSHKCSLVIKDISKVEEVAELLEFVVDAQHWFSTQKVAAMLAAQCKQEYGRTRCFLWPASTRFGGMLLQFKRFKSLRSAMHKVVMSAEYEQFV